MGAMLATALPHPGTASLPMYDFDELRAAHDTLWSAIAATLGDRGVPLVLTHAIDVHALWHAPDLVLSQACGWPLVAELDGVVRTIGTFSYDVPSARDHRYRSQIVMRADRVGQIEPAELTAAVNSFESLSGWLSLVRSFPTLDGIWPGDVLQTGAHLQSLVAVGLGHADVAAIDGVTFAIVQRHRPTLLDGIEVVGDGPLIPCLPLITSQDATDDDVAAIRAALADTVATRVGQDVLDALLITGFHPLDRSAYQSVRALAADWPGGPAGRR
jgi:ABC-type phosphate/phosphonate transport system substrate-binding protein